MNAGRNEPTPRALSPVLLDAAVELMGRAGRGATVRVQGQSMIPTLRADQLVAVEFANTAVSFGELVVFRQQDYLVVHRALGRARAADGTACLRTRGDGLSELDPPLAPPRLVARVVALELADGRWMSLAGPRARIYARAVALHDLGWAAVVVLARALDRRLVRVGLRGPLAGWATRLDRMLLALAHRLFFARMHRASPPPELPRAPDGTTPDPAR